MIFHIVLNSICSYLYGFPSILVICCLINLIHSNGSSVDEVLSTLWKHHCYSHWKWKARNKYDRRILSINEQDVNKHRNIPKKWKTNERYVTYWRLLCIASSIFLFIGTTMFSYPERTCLHPLAPFFNLFVRYFLPSHTVALSFGQQLHYPFILETISRTVLRVQY